MPKAYWIANGDIRDMDALWRYRDANRATLNKYGAKFLVVHGQQRVVEGTSRTSQTVVEFPSYEAAVAAYDDPGYQEAAKIRMAVSESDLVIVEGFDEPPGF